MAAAGIDYGSGRANVHPETGIRYGVISVHSLGEWTVGEAESIYPEKVEVECPKCGQSFETDNLDADDQTCPDEKCEEEFSDHSLYELEPIGWDYAPNDPLYETDYSESLNCVFVTKSPFFTYGAYCSPCAPGAVDLDTALPPDEGQKAYCFGVDFFDDNKPPYSVWSVETGELVYEAKS